LCFVNYTPARPAEAAPRPRDTHLFMTDWLRLDVHGAVLRLTGCD
jgi:hypothetical protein